MSAILHGFSINPAGSPRRLAQRDTEAYWRRLLSLGGTDINANDEVVRIQEALNRLYGLRGRDALDMVLFLRSGQSVGSGNVAPTIFGGLATLLDGPVWTTGGLATNADNSRVDLPVTWVMSAQRAAIVGLKTNVIKTNSRILGSTTTPLQIFAGTNLGAYDNDSLLTRAPMGTILAGAHTLITVQQPSAVRSEASQNRSAFAGVTTAAYGSTPFTLSLTRTGTISNHLNADFTICVVFKTGVVLAKTESDSAQLAIRDTILSDLSLP